MLETIQLSGERSTNARKISRLDDMLCLQAAMNDVAKPDWKTNPPNWSLAIIAEAGELLDHLGYKWWKSQTPDLAQAQMEVVDLWHFELSAVLCTPGLGTYLLHRIHGATVMQEPYVGEFSPDRDLVFSLTQDYVASAARSASSSLRRVTSLLDLAYALGLTFDDLYKLYTAKNVLNMFRQDHGYKTGTYIKVWDGKEDNQHLQEILNERPDATVTELLAALKLRYPVV